MTKVAPAAILRQVLHIEKAGGTSWAGLKVGFEIEGGLV